MSKISFINFRLGFLVKSVSFSLAANLAANAKFLQNSKKNQLLMYSHMLNAFSNVFFILNSINFSVAANLAAMGKNI